MPKIPRSKLHGYVVLTRTPQRYSTRFRELPKFSEKKKEDILYSSVVLICVLLLRKTEEIFLSNENKNNSEWLIGCLWRALCPPWPSALSTSSSCWSLVLPSWGTGSGSSSSITSSSSGSYPRREGRGWRVWR